MILKNNLILEEKGRKPIVYDVCYSPSQTQKPIVIFCHGYKGFKDWGAWQLVAKAFAESGFFFLKFNFSHNGGTIEEPIDFPDLEAFGQNNFSKELDDLESILDFISEPNPFQKEINSHTIALIGHSRGGGIVLIKAEENPKIKKVITWAGVSDFKTRFNEHTNEFKRWKETGITYVENGRTKQLMPHSFQFYENFITNQKRLTIHRAVKKLIIPQLIIHGSGDPTIPVEEARNMQQWNPKSKLAVIENANHVFGSSHPWKQDKLPNDLEIVVNKSIDFLKQRNS